MGGETDGNIDLFGKLPDNFRKKFIREVVLRTSPADACRLSVVSKSFRSAADSDFVWERFIPSEFFHFVEKTRSYMNFSSITKELVNFVFINKYDEGWTDPMDYWLDKWSGKRGLLMPSSILSITKLNTDYWIAVESPVPELGHVVWLEIQGKLSTTMLAPNTIYTICLVFELSDYFYYGFHLPIEAFIGITGDVMRKKIVYLDPRLAKSQSDRQYPNSRDADSCLEVELGDYFNKEGEKRDLEITVMEVKSGRPKAGASIRGFEIRPKCVNRLCRKLPNSDTNAIVYCNPQPFLID